MDQAAFEAEYAAKVERINSAFSGLGWVFNPHHVFGLDMDDVMAVVVLIETGLLAIDQDGYDRVCEVVQQCILYPRHRAFYLSRASQLPPLQKVNHHLERAHTRFFSRDYFSTSLLLLTAVEGTMREHIGYFEPNADHRKILRRIEKRTSTVQGTFAARYPLYRKWLVYAIQEWLFKGTEQARRNGALALTAMFRGNALHGETAGAY